MGTDFLQISSNMLVFVIILLRRFVRAAVTTRSLFCYSSVWNCWATLLMDLTKNRVRIDSGSHRRRRDWDSLALGFQMSSWENEKQLPKSSSLIHQQRLWIRRDSNSKTLSSVSRAWLNEKSINPRTAGSGRYSNAMLAVATFSTEKSTWRVCRVQKTRRRDTSIWTPSPRSDDTESKIREEPFACIAMHKTMHKTMHKHAQTIVAQKRCVAERCARCEPRAAKFAARESQQFGNPYDP